MALRAHCGPITKPLPFPCTHARLLTHRHRIACRSAPSEPTATSSGQQLGSEPPDQAPREAGRKLVTHGLLPEQALQAAAQLPGQAAQVLAHLPEQAVHVVEHLPEHAAHAAHMAVEVVLGPEDLGPEAQRHSIREMTRDVYRQVVYFLAAGAACVFGLTIWAAGLPLSRHHPYSFTILLPEAPGVRPGVPVRFKGVTIGAVHRVSADLNQAYVEVEVYNQDTRIPKVSGTRFELNRTGMLNPECFLDVSSPALHYEQPTAAAAGQGSAQPAGAYTGIPTAYQPTPSHILHSRLSESLRNMRQQQQRREHAGEAAGGEEVSPAAVVAAAVAAASEARQQQHVVPKSSVATAAEDGQQQQQDEQADQGSDDDVSQTTSTQRTVARGRDDNRPAGRSSTQRGDAPPATLQQVVQGARPTQVSACREQGMLVCAGDVVQGHLGGSTDELNRRFVLSHRGPGKVQGIQGVHYN